MPRALWWSQGGLHILMSEVPLDRCTEIEFFSDNLLVRIHLIVDMILVDRPCAMGVGIPILQVALFSR